MRDIIIARKEAGRDTAALVALVTEGIGEAQDVAAQHAARCFLQEGADEARARNVLAVLVEPVGVDGLDEADDLVERVVGQEDALEGAAAVDAQG